MPRPFRRTTPEQTVPAPSPPDPAVPPSDPADSYARQLVRARAAMREHRLHVAHLEAKVQEHCLPTAAVARELNVDTREITSLVKLGLLEPPVVAVGTNYYHPVAVQTCAEALAHLKVQVPA